MKSSSTIEKLGERADSDKLLHDRVADTLRTEIALGKHPVGSWFATEAELCKRFDVSRHTVREALRSLGELGLVERRQGAGTRVVAKSARPSYVHTLSTLSELLQYSKDTRLEIGGMSVVALNESEAAQIPASVGSRWLKITGVRRTALTGQDVAHTVVLTHLRFAPALSNIKEYTGPIFEIIERHSGELVIEVRQQISGGALPPYAAEALSLPPKSPGICVTRRYLDVSGSPMLTAINWHDAERFTYEIALRRDSAV